MNANPANPDACNPKNLPLLLLLLLLGPPELGGRLPSTATRT